MQVPLAAHQVCERHQDLPDLRVALAQHPQPPVAIPRPERVRAASQPGHQRAPGRVATHHGAVGETTRSTSSIGSVNLATAAACADGHRFLDPASSASAARSAPDSTGDVS
jgi:hypothetical protein